MQNDIGALSIGVKLGDVIKVGDDIEIIFAKNLSASWINLIIKAPKNVKIDSVTRHARKKMKVIEND